MKTEKIISIEEIGSSDTIDIEVSGDHLFFANDILTHNSAIDSVEFNHSHIAGGLSKIQTADNAIGIFSSAQSRARGEIEFQLLKTRNSGGVNGKITLGYDPDTLRISDMDVNKLKASNSKSNILDRINRKTNLQPSKASEEQNDNVDAKPEDPIARAARLKNLVKGSEE